MASIEKRGKNSFRLIVEAGYDAASKRIKKTKTIKIEDESLLKTTKKLRDYLNDELVKFKIEVEAGEYISPEKLTFRQFVENEWKLKFAEKELSPLTLTNYMTHLRTHILPVLGHLQLEQIKTIRLVSFLNDLYEPEARKDGKESRLSDSTIHDIYKVMKSVFTKAIEWRILSINPMDGVKRPKIEKQPMKYFEEEEAQKVIQALYEEPTLWRLYFLGAMLGGFRRGELLALEWPEVNFEDSSITVKKSISLTQEGQAVVKDPKTESSKRVVDMPIWYMRDLRDFHLQWRKEKLQLGDAWDGGDAQYVFHGGTGKPFYHSTPSLTWRRFLKRHNLKSIRLHDLRHTAATLLIESGVDLKAVQERLGHSKYQTTADIYAHVTKKVSRETADKLNKFDPNNFVPNSSPTAN